MRSLREKDKFDEMHKLERKFRIRLRDRYIDKNGANGVGKRNFVRRDETQEQIFLSRLTFCNCFGNPGSALSRENTFEPSKFYL